MVGRSSPKFNMVGRSSPKMSRLLSMASATKKKISPKCRRAKKSATSPRGKQRACWNPSLEKSLVDILYEHKDNGFRGDNGWNTEGWNKMAKEFNERNKYAFFTRNQIQEKEKELKRDYKLLKEARRQSGCTWNEERCTIECGPALWDNMIISFPRIKKFRNNKASFPLYDALGELYDGHLAEGSYNFTSIEPPQEEESMAYDLEDEAGQVDRRIEDEVNFEMNEEMLHSRIDGPSRDEEAEVASTQKMGQQKRAALDSRNKGKEPSKPKKGANIEAMMERYLEMRTKQVEDEAAHLAKEKSRG